MELCARQECVVKCQESLKIWICHRFRNCKPLPMARSKRKKIENNFMKFVESYLIKKGK